MNMFPYGTETWWISEQRPGQTPDIIIALPRVEKESFPGAIRVCRVLDVLKRDQVIEKYRLALTTLRRAFDENYLSQVEKTLIRNRVDEILKGNK